MERSFSPETCPEKPDGPLSVRGEHDGDANAIFRLTEAAFLNAPHTSHTEQFIVNALRRHGQLTVSLVAVDGGRIVGHVAISPVTLTGGTAGWHGLGPISVQPKYQGRGIGSWLARTALDQLRNLGARGCVVLGDPAYYGRFGFVHSPGLVLPGVPQEYFQALPFSGDAPQGEVRYHAAFDAAA